MFHVSYVDKITYAYHKHVWFKNKIRIIRMNWNYGDDAVPIRRVVSVRWSNGEVSMLCSERGVKAKALSRAQAPVTQSCFRRWRPTMPLGGLGKYADHRSIVSRTCWRTLTGRGSDSPAGHGHNDLILPAAGLAAWQIQRPATAGLGCVGADEAGNLMTSSSCISPASATDD